MLSISTSSLLLSMTKRASCFLGPVYTTTLRLALLSESFLTLHEYCDEEDAHDCSHRAVTMEIVRMQMSYI